MPKGTKLGSAFKGMLSTCPGEISSYAKCLTLNADGVEKGVCEKEFLALKTCFRKVKPVKR